MVKLGWHFDFHSHGTVRIGHAPDFAGAAAALKDAGVDEVITFAKCHNGFSYYPTRVATPHPLMKGDVFGGMLRACRKQGMRVFAYVSFGLDGEAVRRRPEWARVGPDGPKVSPDHFNSVCPYTGYLDELMLPQIDEIIRLYRPDGLWFDTMGALGLCYCEPCRNAFREAHGGEIPREANDPLWPECGSFRRKRGFALIEQVGDFIRERLPRGEVGFNGIGWAQYPEKMPKSITRLTGDPWTAGHQSRGTGFNAAYAATADRTPEMMPTIFNQGWGDWSLSTPERMEKVAAVVWARQVRLFMGDRLSPEGRLSGATLRALQTFKEIRRRISAEFPPENSQPDDDVLIVQSASLPYGEDLRHFGIKEEECVLLLEGAHNLLTDAGASFTVLGETFLSPALRRAGLAILPQLPAISPETNVALKRFVERGGKVLVVGGVPRVGGKPMDWLGVERASEPWQDHIWLPAWSSMSHDMPVLVRGEFRKLRLRGARAAARAIQPYDLVHGVRFGWGIGPPSDAPSPHPALTRRRVGQGEAWYLEAPLFSDYAATSNWQQIEWMSGLLETILPAPRARLSASAGNVELIVRRTKDATWATLVNHGGEEVTTIRRGWTRALPPLPAYRVTLELRDGRRPRRVSCNGADCRWERRGSTLSVPLVLDGPWKVVRVDWETARRSS